MTNFKRIFSFIFLTCFLALLTQASFAAASISASNTTPLPSFSLPSIFTGQKKLTDESMQGRVSLINIWASWCSACASEHRMLLKIKNQFHVPIYGILFKDDPSDALRYLKNHGNPYVQVGYDLNGDSPITENLYGTPETLVVSPDGNILYRQVGAINEMTWDVILYPLVKQYENKA
ncbi:MAG TPA: redoxin family protein [Gammaproteobacteria bacterium]|jgi:cytochrome c biogenesis protein CcmG/thiol:disulfide interchange protein DsbE|nr:redoxin family protein [Gammaproteobacteria bacterium]